MTSTVGGVQDFVVENRKVESETEADRMGGREFGLGNVGCTLKCNLVRCHNEIICDVPCTPRELL